MSSTNEIIKSKIEDPLLSIVIPTYKRVNGAISAIKSVLVNTDIVYEIVVINNDPLTDNAIEKFVKNKGSNISYYINKKNLGMFGNWNKGISLAKGKYITILHDDDTLDKEYLDNMVEAIRKLPTKESIIAPVVKMISKNKKDNLITSIRNNFLPKDRKLIEINHKHLVFRNPIIGTLGVLIPRKKLIDLGGFKEDFHPLSDYYFWNLWLKKGFKIYRLNKILGSYFIESNETMNPLSLKKMVNGSYELRDKIIHEQKISSFYKIISYMSDKVMKYRMYQVFSEKSYLSSIDSKLVDHILINKFSYIFLSMVLRLLERLLVQRRVL